MKLNLKFCLSENRPLAPIETAMDYEAALSEVEWTMHYVSPDSPEGIRLDRLIDLIVAYEDVHYLMGDSSLVEDEAIGESE